MRDLLRMQSGGRDDGESLTHEEVQEAASQAAPLFTKLVAESVKKFL